MEAHSLDQVTIVPVPGFWVPVNTLLPPPSPSPELCQHLLDLTEPVSFHPDKTEKASLPVLPAATPYPPEELLQPAKSMVAAPLKGAASPYSQTVASGFRSGARSALIPCRILPSASDDDKTDSALWVIAVGPEGERYVPDPKGTVLLRLKGCGMWLPSNPEPFPGITNRSRNYIPGIVEVRGVCFPDTAATEQYYSNIVAQQLKRIHCIPGNTPLGYWQYGQLRDDPSPLVTKTVSI